MTENLSLPFAKKPSGKLFGDKGYISQALFEKLLGKGIKFVTGIMRNMKNSLWPLINQSV